MGMDEFSQQLQSILTRASTLRERASEASPAALELFPQSLDELYLALEELHQQTEALAETQLTVEHERLRYQELFDFAPDGYLVTDREGVIQEANHAAGLLLNVEPRFLIGKLFVTFIAMDDRLAWRTWLAERLETPETQLWETRLQPHELPLIDVELRVGASRQRNGQIASIRWLIRDVTECRREQQQLKVLNTQLEQRVAERTAEMKNAIRLRDEFLSIAAHELKTPITSLRGYAQVIMRQLGRHATLDSTVLHNALQTIDQQSAKLTTLIAQLLDVRRIEDGRLHLARERTDMARLLRELMIAIQMTASKHHLTLHTPSEVYVQVDPIRLEQALTNLIDNAIKYSPDGGDIELEVSTPTPEQVCISVTDHGLGVPPEYRARIFDRFYRVPSTQHIGGLGLGLNISQQIIEQHDGTIRAEFPEMGGTRFVVTLPTHLETTA